MTTYDTPSLFDAPIDRGTHRKADPAASRLAAAEMAGDVLNAEQRRVFDALRSLDASGDPMTAGRVTALLGDRQRNCVARRITDLAQSGLVADTGEVWREERKGARPETLWKLVRHG